MCATGRLGWVHVHKYANVCTGPHRCHIILELIEFDGGVTGDDRIVGTVLYVLSVYNMMWQPWHDVNDTSDVVELGVYVCMMQRQYSVHNKLSSCLTKQYSWTHRRKRL